MLNPSRRHSNYRERQAQAIMFLTDASDRYRKDECSIGTLQFAIRQCDNARVKPSTVDSLLGGLDKATILTDR